MAKIKPTDEQKLIYSMMTERVGHSILDSGGIYGYNHDANKKRSIQDFINEPEEWIELSKYQENARFESAPRYEMCRHVSIFHYLCGGEVDEICKKFNRRNANAKDWDGDKWGWGVSKSAAKYLDELEKQGLIESFAGPHNSYNYSNELTGTYQYSWLAIDGWYYILFQYHGGCDVRGGYTDAKMLRLGEQYYIHEYLREYDEMQGLIGSMTSTDEWEIDRWPVVIGPERKEMSHQDVIDFFTELLEEMRESQFSKPEDIQDVEQIIESVTLKKQSYDAA